MSLPLTTIRIVSHGLGGTSFFSATINSGVHVIMYTYYALSVFPRLAPWLWWKRYLTLLQLVRGSDGSVTSPSCSWCVCLVVFMRHCSYTLCMRVCMYLCFGHNRRSYAKPGKSTTMDARPTRNTQADPY